VIAAGKPALQTTKADAGRAMSQIGEICYDALMTKEQVKEILDRIRTWSPEDQERVARFAQELELAQGDDGLSDTEWKLIEQRAARRNLASYNEVEAVFSRYRGT